MKIKEHVSPDNQMACLGRHKWAVSRLFKLAESLPVFDAPLDCLDVNIKYGDMRLRELVGHIKAALNADLSYPIILDEDGEIMDGCHRVMKAILEGHKTIKAVRFEENPQPCRIED